MAEIGKWRFGGFFAWMLWGGIHILFLIGFRNRLQVMASWFWNWLLNARDARLITGETHVDIDMTLTAPGCPVAGEMPNMVSEAIKTVKGVGEVKVNMTFDPPWTPERMSEEAKLELNMF